MLLTGYSRHGAQFDLPSTLYSQTWMRGGLLGKEREWEKGVEGGE